MLKFKQISRVLIFLSKSDKRFPRKARQRSAQGLIDSSNTGFQRLDTEKINLTEEQIADLTQQIENKVVRKVKDEIRKTEITILRTLSSLSQNSLQVISLARTPKLRQKKKYQSGPI